MSDRYAELVEALRAVKDAGSVTKAAKALGIPRVTLHDRYQAALAEGIKESDDVQTCETQGGISLVYIGDKFTTADEVLEHCKIDMGVFEIERVVVNPWEVSGKIKTKDGEQVWKTTNLQIKITLKRKSDENRSLEVLLEKLESASPVVKKYKRPRPRRTFKHPRRALELTIVDPHFGLRCHKPSSQDTWSLDECHQIYQWAVDELLEQAELYGPFDEILFPIGNDYMHADGVFHMTTAGTPQPEMEPWLEVFVRAEEALMSAITRISQVAPVKVKVIPGNHDRQSSFSMGRVVNAYFRNDENVDVDCSARSYKHWHYGCNMVGLEHGHSINQIRLAAVMANEWPEAWLATKGGYREWHLGDQHRKGSSKPSVFEEQGVSVEFLPGLTAVNEWHTLKSFSWQKRGAMGYVWDHAKGPIARIQCNLDSWTGLPMGS